MKSKPKKSIQPDTKAPQDENAKNIAQDDPATRTTPPPATTTTTSIPSSWLASLAIFGDSSWALVASFGLLVVAVGVALYMDDGIASNSNDDPFETAYQQLGPIPKIDAPRIFEFRREELVTEEMRIAFAKDGVIAVRGILDPELLERLDAASNSLILEQQAKNKKKPKILTGRKTPSNSQFFTVQQGAVFLNLTKDIDEGDDSTQPKEEILPPFLEVSLASDIPKIVADLLQLQSANENKTETLRLMRDIFLTKDEEEYVCGWHVDDTGFWPATAAAPGVNAWIALDDMPIERGGGFALAVGSHTAAWKEEAYQVTGSTHTFPLQGFSSAQDVLDRRVGNGTCNIATAAPHLQRRMEDTKRIYDLQRGDVIFHTRWLFHRTVPFVRQHDEANANANTDNGDQHQPLLYRRYSIRYGPGSSEIPRGFGTEPSVIWQEQNGGRTADQVAEQDAAWYPQAWPPTTTSDNNKELDQMKMIAQERLPAVLGQANVRRKQMRPQRTSRYSKQPH
jgi:hypothetical protein